jgi:hypothetical protein
MPKNDAGKRLQNSDEMWLMYYKWNLRTTCNAILDFSVHANNMSKTSAAFIGCGAFNSKRKRMENGIELPYRSSFVHTLRATLKFMILEKERKGRCKLKQFHENSKLR